MSSMRETLDEKLARFEELEQKLIDPVLQEISVGQAFEQCIPVVLMQIYEARQHDRIGRIKDGVEPPGQRRGAGWPKVNNIGSIDGDVSIGPDVAVRVDGDDVAIVNKRACHKINRLGYG